MIDQRGLKVLIDQRRNDTDNEERLKLDYEKYKVYNGSLRDKITEIIKSEFKDSDTITELTNRIVPINITAKIVNKLGTVYKYSAIRSPAIEDDNDQELIDIYSRALDINHYMAFCNRMVKNTKHALLEPYLDMQKRPRVRVLPSHTFDLYSNDPINPERATAVLKHLVEGQKEEQQRFAYWDEHNHWLVDGTGQILWQEMQAMGNEQGINPYGVLPFTHVTQQSELLYPIQSSDIMAVQIAVCLLLSDSTLAQKYLSWATLVLSGVEGDQKVKVGPAAILSLPKTLDGQNPDAKYIQPNLNSDEVIRLVEKLVQYVLETNNLSSKTMSGQLTASASGVSKMFDEIESTEDINEQRKIYIKAEQDLWDKFAHYMLPVWVKSQEINPEYAGTFSSDFEINVKYPEAKILMSKKERIENVRLELEAGTTSLRRAIKEINPDMEDQEIDDLITEIRKEKLDSVSFFERNMSNNDQTV
jgi:hypothetical protein